MTLTTPYKVIDSDGDTLELEADSDGHLWLGTTLIGVSLNAVQVAALVGELATWLIEQSEPVAEIGDTVRVLAGRGVGKAGNEGELRPREEASCFRDFEADFADHPYAVRSAAGFTYFVKEVELVKKNHRPKTLSEVREERPGDQFPDVGYVRGFLYDHAGK